ncbi:MAG: TetR/AcrR family transcriptional regulator [Negativicutes bacterium]|nr:TetR/AcrR family transcriptional regulator [Negativicutes bacterium]
MTTQRRDQILDAFVRIVADHGINRTTMRDVAREIGCSVGTIYNEFANKEALIDGLLERAQTEIDHLLKNLSVSCQAAPEMRLRRFMIGFIRAVNLKMRQDLAFTEFVKEAKHYRHIGTKTTYFGKTVKGKVVKILEDILELGVREGAFQIENIPMTARLVREAFTEYLIPFLILERKLEDILQDAEDMLDLIIKSLRTV